MIKCIDKMKQVFLFLILNAVTAIAFSQVITLEEAYQLARDNYPAIQKEGLIKKSTAYSLQNANKSYLPQFSLAGQATYQSDVTRIPVNLPGVKEMSKDQYRIQAEITQLLYDGGAVNAQKEMLKANESTQLQLIEVTMQAVRERITDMYFGVLLMDEQLAQYKLRRENLEAALKKAEAAYSNGAGFKSNVNELKAELLNADMSATEIKADQKAFKDMLGLILGKPISDNFRFEKPSAVATPNLVKRPEVKLFDLQKIALDAQKKKWRADWMPKISAFAQGGYGRPGLNMLDNDFNPYAIGGIRLSFPINNMYTWKNNVKMLEINKQQLEADKETFLLNNNATLAKQQMDQEKYAALISEDDKIIELRQEVAKSAQAQLDNNVITVSEFINKLNAAHLARQLKYLHELQLLKAKFNYFNTSGY